MTSIGCAVAFLRSLYSWAQGVLPMPTLNSLLLITITSRYRHSETVQTQQIHQLVLRETIHLSTETA